MASKLAKLEQVLGILAKYIKWNVWITKLGYFSKFPINENIASIMENRKHTFYCLSWARYIKWKVWRIKLGIFSMSIHEKIKKYCGGQNIEILFLSWARYIKWKVWSTTCIISVSKPMWKIIVLWRTVLSRVYQMKSVQDKNWNIFKSMKKYKYHEIGMPNEKYGGQKLECFQCPIHEKV